MICFERVRELRDNQDMTQKMIADILAVDKSTYAAWERGRDLFPLKRLINLCNFYHVSVDFITGMTDIQRYEDLKSEINPHVLKIRLRDIRKEFCFTQERLAAELNTTHSAISAYENGHLIMPLIFLFQISKTFHISIDYMLGKTNKKKIEEKTLEKI